MNEPRTTPGTNPISKSHGCPGGDSTSISMSADGPVKLRLWTGMISKDSLPIR